MDLAVWLTAFAACWAISLSPGAGAVAAMNAGLRHGVARGLWCTVGLVLGIWTQLVVVAAGLGALIATSSLAFSVIKWAGVAYLVGIGVQQWRAPPQPLAAAGEGPGEAMSRRRLVLRGWAVNALNPKGTVFLLAVVPQFLDLARPLTTQYAVIGATLAFTDLVVMTGYTALAARVLGALRSARSQRLLQRGFGGLFIAAGVLLATVRRNA
ncbi:LysE family transporter [Aquabacterium sp. J223]|uniref:LysE family transporter n=1 Tax=Aquabacterium sp. J223 TaxID=2898431 RepID=UPI0021ADF4E9|nr:LysE family transporter [Aquabacterium sp. J223]UUX96327.1 LysE family transporter [Aquabacterium sp. J223]